MNNPMETSKFDIKIGPEVCQMLEFRFFKISTRKLFFKSTTSHSKQNLEIDYEFGIWHPEIHSQKSKIKFSYSAPISVRDHDI